MMEALSAFFVASIWKRNSKRLDAVIEECITAKRFSNLRPVYVHELRRFLTRFKESLGNPYISDITPAKIQGWLAKPQWSDGTRATGLNRLSSLFSFAFRRGYIPFNPVDRIDRIRLERKPPQILTPAEAILLLASTKRVAPTMWPNIVLGLFAGIRPAELDRLQSQDVDTARAIVRIDTATSKVRCRRIVELQPRAVLLLDGCLPAGPITPKQKKRKMRRIAKAMGWTFWPKDILRHTAASFLMAKHRNADLVADMLGNSPGILLRHYRELVSAEDCTAFWSPQD